MSDNSLNIFTFVDICLKNKVRIISFTLILTIISSLIYVYNFKQVYVLETDIHMLKESDTINFIKVNDNIKKVTDNSLLLFNADNFYINYTSKFNNIVSLDVDLKNFLTEHNTSTKVNSLFLSNLEIKKDPRGYYTVTTSYSNKEQLLELTNILLSQINKLIFVETRQQFKELIEYIEIKNKRKILSLNGELEQLNNYSEGQLDNYLEYLRDQLKVSNFLEVQGTEEYISNFNNFRNIDTFPRYLAPESNENIYTGLDYLKGSDALVKEIELIEGRKSNNKNINYFATKILELNLEKSTLENNPLIIYLKKDYAEIMNEIQNFKAVEYISHVSDLKSKYFDPTKIVVVFFLLSLIISIISSILMFQYKIFKLET